MKKKLLTLFLSIILVASMLVTPIIADEENEKIIGPGGLDFYSITIYYDSPTVVEYQYVTKTDSTKEELIWYINPRGKKTYTDGFIFAEPTDKYVLRAGDTKDTGYTMYKAKAGASANFNGIKSQDYSNDALYSTFPYKYAYITHVQNDTTVYSNKSIFFRGITRVSDDAGNINPNYELTSDGYVKTADGEYKIDPNGFLLYDNDVWKDKDGNTIVLFTEDPDDKDKLVLETKYDENGKVRFLKPTDPLYLYRVHDREDGNYTEADIIKDELGRKLQGEPVQGQPALKSKITKITIELDAMGTKLYTDLSDDPQQVNEVIITLNEWYEKILVDQYNAPKDKKTGEIINPDAIRGKIVTTVKSQTTKTEANFTDKEKAPTYKSIQLDLSAEELEALPAQAVIFLTFKIGEHQPEAAFDEKKTIAIVTAYEELPEKKEPVEEETNWLLIGGIAGGAVLIIAIVIIIIVVAKKKPKKEESQE